MSFFQRVYEIVKQVPRGKVASYGQIAYILAEPRSARQVGWALNGLPKTKQSDEVPWWRVINAKGYLSIKSEDIMAKFRQRELLEAEGIEVSDEFMVDMKRYQWEKI